MQQCEHCGNSRLWLELSNGSTRCLQCGTTQETSSPKGEARTRSRSRWVLVTTAAILATTAITIRFRATPTGPAQTVSSKKNNYETWTRPQPNKSIRLEPLLADLDRGDQSLVPRQERLPDGSIEYHYKRKAGQGDLSLEELEHLAKNPPDHSKKRQDIVELLTKLDRLGVTVLIEQTHDSRAAGTWTPSSASVRIKPEVVGQGTEEFHEVLSHESVHVAQSCANGNITSRPIALNISLKYSPIIDNSIDNPLYHGGSGTQLTIEREAYSHSQEEGAALRLLNYYCR
jgi:hypothetical protein